jgi:hypothetical protein
MKMRDDRLLLDNDIEMEDIELFSHVHLTDENFPIFEALCRELKEIVRDLQI